MQFLSFVNKMLTKLLILFLIIESFVINAKNIQEFDDYYDEKEITDSTLPSRSGPTVPTTQSPTIRPPTTTSPVDTIQICTQLKPHFISTRKEGYQKLECSSKLCDSNGNDATLLSTVSRFNRPIFDWNSQFGHIFASNSTCDYEGLNCWHTINIDLEYLSHQMVDNVVNELQLSCSVSDYLRGNDEDNTQWSVGSDISVLKSFKGKGIDESCDDDNECGENMICLGSDRNGGASCQCSLSFVTGVPYVQVLDDKYEEWICLAPRLINESCLYDRQCQAMDSNSECDQKHIDAIDFGVGTCLCAPDMVYAASGCEPQAVGVTGQPTVIWWVFSSDDSTDSSVHRFWWLRTASYLTAVLAILLPITFIFIALVALCLRRLSNRRPSIETVIRPKFPAAAPKIVISDFIKKEKSDDKWNLVKNDHLITQ